MPILYRRCSKIKKRSTLAYLAVLTALRLECDILFHVQAAKGVGATRAEVISAVLIGLPAAVASYDAP